MKLFMIFLFVIICSPVLMTAQSEDADPYSVKLVQAAVTARSQGIIIAKIQTRLARMGDAVAIALLKIFNEGELKDPQTIESFLPIIHDSFSQPQFISVDADKKPMVTLFLLEQLRRNIGNTQTGSAIEETIKFVKEKASTEPAELPR